MALPLYLLVSLTMCADAGIGADGGIGAAGGIAFSAMLQKNATLTTLDFSGES